MWTRSNADPMWTTLCDQKCKPSISHIQNLILSVLYPQTFKKVWGSNLHYFVLQLNVYCQLHATTLTVLESCDIYTQASHYKNVLVDLARTCYLICCIRMSNNSLVHYAVCEMRKYISSFQNHLWDEGVCFKVCLGSYTGIYCCPN